MAKKYPVWRKLVWRYVRVFVSAFVAQFGLNLVLFGDPEAVRSLAVAAVAAGLSALAKSLREDKPYSSNVHKLPL